MTAPLRRTAVLAAVSLAGALVLGGCGSDKKSEAEAEHEALPASATETCVADAEQVSSLPDGFPTDFPFPDRTVVYDAEDRGADGVIATGVTSLPFEQVLAALNGPAQDAGFEVEHGETEEHDAEADWRGNGFEGRWAIRESGKCQGETVVQVVARAE
ncbi:hypothetical protein [Nocardioides marmoribigeumensis]|uniref:Lipoprotein n=1 Tax=Nocardioides marmoribigeumensis TaxID=433649 RepID=A0ABU2BYC6_9ACTN|nr:hypothetical protein [Nocardioides marmoribigeumensis]MDR7363405.1 hypothetical protein [Nocardioides marmoribigeumensis]